MRNWRQHKGFAAAACALLAWAVFGLAYSVHHYRHRFVREDSDMFAFLPHADPTLFYANLNLLRKAGYINTLLGSQNLVDAEYKAFLDQTHFDYQRDIDSLAGASDGAQLFFIVKGRFDWQNLRAYAGAHGGKCDGTVCSAPTSQANQWASFIEVQPDVLGLALSPDRAAALSLSPRRDAVREAIPDGPIWMKVSHSVLRDPTQIPLAFRIFAVTLQSADSVTLSLTRATSGTAVFNLRLDALCPNKPAAESARNQMEIQTRMLKFELSRENHKPDPSDLSGLLLEGTFQAVDRSVIGLWPVHKELLDVLK